MPRGVGNAVMVKGRMARTLGARGLVLSFFVVACCIALAWRVGPRRRVEAAQPASPAHKSAPIEAGGTLSASASASSTEPADEAAGETALVSAERLPSTSSRVEVELPQRRIGPRFSHAKVEIFGVVKSYELELELGRVQVLAHSQATVVVPGRSNSVMAKLDARGFFAADVTELFIGVAEVPQTLRVIAEAPSGCTTHRDFEPGISAQDVAVPSSIVRSVTLELRCVLRVRGRVAGAGPHSPAHVELLRVRSSTAPSKSEVAEVETGDVSRPILDAFGSRDASFDPGSRMTTMTDDGGRFEFEVVRGGRYVVRLSGGEGSALQREFEIVDTADVELGDLR